MIIVIISSQSAFNKSQMCPSKQVLPSLRPFHCTYFISPDDLTSCWHSIDALRPAKPFSTCIVTWSHSNTMQCQMIMGCNGLLSPLYSVKYIECFPVTLRKSVTAGPFFNICGFCIHGWPSCFEEERFLCDSLFPGVKRNRVSKSMNVTCLTNQSQGDFMKSVLF